MFHKLLSLFIIFMFSNIYPITDKRKTDNIIPFPDQHFHKIGSIEKHSIRYQIQ